MYKCIDLFAGIGGIRLGFEQAFGKDIKTVFISEIDKYARTTYKENFKDVTKIIVAQRINTIIDAEQIIVLEEGKIVGKGTHEELMKNCKTYKEIADAQLGGEENEQ